MNHIFKKRVPLQSEHLVLVDFYKEYHLRFPLDGFCGRSLSQAAMRRTRKHPISQFYQRWKLQSARMRSAARPQTCSRFLKKLLNNKFVILIREKMAEKT